MKHYPAPQLDPATVERIRLVARSGATREELLGTMRAEGLSMVPSIRLLSQLSGLSTSEAKEAVHFSQTWADCLKTNNAIQEAACEALRLMGATEVELDEHSEPAELQAQSR